jgi:hypothetical protein
MGVVEARERKQTAWFVERLREVGTTEGGLTIGQVVELLRQILWIEDLHGIKF